TVPIFKFMPDFDASKTKALFIRSTDKPLVRLCETLYDWSEKLFPTYSGEPIDIRAIRGAASNRDAFVKENSTSVPNLMQVLRRIQRLLPKWLVLVIDQGEEVLTLRSDESDNSPDLLFEFMTEFNNSSMNLKLVVALRTEYFGDFLEEMRVRGYDPTQLAWFRLKELSDSELEDAIRGPTSRKVLKRYLQERPQPGD